MTATTITSKSFKAATIVGDLCRALPPSLSPNSFGLLSCSPEANSGAFIADLQAALPFPVAGGTTWALPFAPRDEDTSVSLTIVSREGLKLAVGVSQALSAAEGRRQMEELYRDCEARLGERPKLLLALLPMRPKLTADRYLPFLFEAAEGLPVFGGMLSDDYKSGRPLVLADGRAFSDRMALVALGGDIEPVFAARCEMNVLSEYLPTVTEAEGYTVRRLDDLSLGDYLARQGFDPGGRDLADWPLSLVIRGRRQPVEGLDDVCDLVKINAEDGSGTTTGLIPVGADLGLGVLSKSGILATADECLADLLGQIEAGRARGRRYSLLFGLPCIARYFVMVGDDEQEGERIKAAVPPELGLFGYYGFNEVCPVRRPDGRLENLLLSDSIIMCAF